ncbi:MAG TPA: rhomboid family intramembrane serine protease [Armatimonadota bacterium]|jgi:membrane associated rhomboid family serine protease
MIPLGDSNPRRSVPFVTWAIIAINAVVFLNEMGSQTRQGMAYLQGFMMVPREIVTGQDLGIPTHLEPVWLTIFSSMFMHANFAHLAGNMLYLWIFGDNIEDRLGHLKYLLFYLACGVAAAAAHILSDPSSMVPTLGASGAIAGVLGAYLIAYPGAQVTTLIPLGFFITIRTLPAWVLLGFWFVFQLLSQGMGSAVGGRGVAYMAHIGGFLAGMALLSLLSRRQSGARYRWHDDY